MASVTDYRIYKYPLSITDEQFVEMPNHWSILSVQAQRGDLMMWALVDVNSQPKTFRFRVVGTGHPVPDVHRLKFIDTVQMFDGALVWHVFIDETYRGKSEIA